MSKPTIIFFGSFLEYSVQVLQALHESQAVEVIGVVTTPPRPAGRKQMLTKTHVHEYADKQGIPVFTPDSLRQTDPDQLTNQSTTTPDFFVVAGYGKLLPPAWLDYPDIAAVNIHFSLLPQYRGAMPGEWAILMDEQQTGVSLIEMSPSLDTGNIFAQSTYEITHTDTRESVYKKLYDLGANLFIDALPHYLDFVEHASINYAEIGQTGKLFLPPMKQSTDPNLIYAKLLNKNDSFVPWRLLQLAQQGQSASLEDLTPLMQELPTKILTQSGLAEAIERMVRGLYGWPGVWTEVNTTKDTQTKKRLKIHSASVSKGKLVLQLVQLEGDTTKPYSQIKDSLD